jgi:predicted phage terminase large subunit-like protein
MITQDTDFEALLFDIEKVQCERSLAEFIKQAWHVIEPMEPYVHGWHVDFICAHLEAISDELQLKPGEYYNRLLANVPPGTMKSLLMNVFWPSWEWGPKNKPHMRYVCAAHKVENLSARDSRRMRQLITSDWYQSRWGDRVKLSKDQNEKLNFTNTAGGFRIATAMTSLTGIRGDRVIIDDPHSVDGADSDAIRASVVQTFLEAVPLRVTSPEKSAIIVIMQRLHEEDVSGAILDKKLGYDHIMLPMRFDPLRRCKTKLGLVDPRRKDGELLFPQRMPERVVDRDERVLGPYATAGQMQQEPAPRGGGIIKREWWETWEDTNRYPPMSFIIASLDTAYTQKEENDPSAMTVWGVFEADLNMAMVTKVQKSDGELGEYDRTYNSGTPRVMLMNAWAERLEFPELIEKVKRTCKQMRVDLLLIEAKASGMSVAQEMRRSSKEMDYGIELTNPGQMDKVARLYSVQHLFSEGMVYAPDKKWVEPVIHQCATVPKAKHDDLADTVSAALKKLRDMGVLQRAPERQQEISESLVHRSKKTGKLYPV